MKLGDIFTCACGRVTIVSRIGQSKCLTCAPSPDLSGNKQSSERVDMVKITIPPTTNHLWEGYGITRKRTPEYEAWRSQNLPAVLNMKGIKPPIAIRLDVWGGANFRENRDIDNCLKVCLDILVLGGIITDDCVKIVKGVEAVYHERSDPVTEAYATIRLFEIRRTD